MNERRGAVRGGRRSQALLRPSWRRRLRWIAIAAAAFAIAEVAVFIVVATEIGILAAIALLVVTSLLGARLATSRSGRHWQEVRMDLLLGRNPNADALHAALLLIAGLLLAVPGFLSDILGLALLLPIIRRKTAQRLPLLLRSPGTARPSPPTSLRADSQESRVNGDEKTPSTTTVTWGKPLPRE